MIPAVFGSILGVLGLTILMRFLKIFVHEMCQLIPLIKRRRAQILWRKRHLKELHYPKNLQPQGWGGTDGVRVEPRL